MRPLGDAPDRLLDGEATDFERRVLLAAREKGPPPASSARLAKALGLTAAGVGTAVAAKAVALESVAAKATSAAGATAAPWVSIGVVGLAVAGAIVGARAWQAAHHPPAPVPPAVSAPVPPAPVIAPPAAPPVHAGEPPRGPGAASRRSRPSAPSGDLRGEIAFIDAARAAVAGNANARALEILRAYQNKYPSGSFRPEASAIEIEALMKLGRETEARALGERFIAEHGGSLLARRVADIAGLTMR
jgi:hypothetical protein